MVARTTAKTQLELELRLKQAQKRDPLHSSPRPVDFSAERRMACQGTLLHYFVYISCISCALPILDIHIARPKEFWGFCLFLLCAGRQKPNEECGMGVGGQSLWQPVSERQREGVRWGPSYHTIKIYEPCACASSQPPCFLADEGVCKGREVKVWHKFYMCHSLTCFLCGTSPCCCCHCRGAAEVMQLRFSALRCTMQPWDNVAATWPSPLDQLVTLGILP